MLDFLRYVRGFPRRNDPAASPRLLHVFLSYISTWQPYTWTFIGTWRRAASLAAGKGGLFLLECRRRENDNTMNAANRPLGRQAYGRSTDPVRSPGFQPVMTYWIRLCKRYVL